MTEESNLSAYRSRAEPGKTFRVEQMSLEATDVVSLRLVDPVDREVPEWEPGAHIDLVLPSGRIRQYSLCGDPSDRRAFLIAVLREPSGRGGSKEIHESALVGKLLTVHGPRNRFQLTVADEYVFIAGGIGITPILTMVRWAISNRKPWRLFYGGRSRRSMAFLGTLSGLETGNVTIVPEDERGLLDVSAIVGMTSSQAEVYCCGPEGLIRAVEEKYERIRRVHTERFSAAEVGADHGLVERETGRPAMTFEVELRRTGVTVEVPPDRSILEIVRRIIPDLVSDCEEGFCGACETTVLAGVPEHHDVILSVDERMEGKSMMICVGRSRSRTLVLDL